MVSSVSSQSRNSTKQLQEQLYARSDALLALCAQVVLSAQKPYGAGVCFGIRGARDRGASGIYKVTCKDNGQGMHHKDIPNMLGRVLSGTKYGVKQTRGKFGLGAKMALLW